MKKIVFDHTKEELRAINQRDRFRVKMKNIINHPKVTDCSKFDARYLDSEFEGDLKVYDDLEFLFLVFHNLENDEGFKHKEILLNRIKFLLSLITLEDLPSWFMEFIQGDKTYINEVILNNLLERYGELCKS